MSDIEEDGQADDAFDDESVDYNCDDEGNVPYSSAGSVFGQDDQGPPFSTDERPPFSTDQRSRFSTDQGTSFATSTAPPRAPVSIRCGPPLSVISEEPSLFMRSSEDERLPAGGKETGVETANSSAFSGFASSFTGISPRKQAANCSEEFAQGADALNLINKAQESFDRSGRRLQIPDQFNSEDFSAAAACFSWENEIAQNKNKNCPFVSASTSIPPAATKPLPATRVVEPKKPQPAPLMHLGLEGTPVKAASSVPPDFSTTPVRPKSSSSFRRDSTVVSSTPKVHSRGLPIPQPDFGEISAINTTMDSTMGNLLSETQLKKAMEGLGPKSSTEEMLAALETWRLEKAAKLEERGKSLSVFKNIPTGRVPFKERQSQTSFLKPRELPFKERQSQTSILKPREVDISRPQPSKMSSTASTSSFHTAINGSSHVSSRNNTQTMSDAYSRPSSITSMQDCDSRPDTRLSMASVCNSDDSKAVTYDRSTLLFSYVEKGGTFVDSVRISNSGHAALTLTLSLRKYDCGYKILDGTTRLLEAEGHVDIRVEFCPVRNERHNNTLNISTNLSQEFHISLRGTGGTPAVSIEPMREKITKNKYGTYLMKPIRDDGLLQFKLKSSGTRRAFCKVIVFGDGQVINCKIAPFDAVVLKPCTEQMFEIKIHDIGRYLTSSYSKGSTVSLASSADGGENIRLKIIVFWGDNGQRKRAQLYLKRSGASTQDPIVQTLMQTKFINEKAFEEPSEWPVSRADVKHFEVSLNKAEIAVLPLAVSRLSNMADFDDTLVSESTFTDRAMVKERTFAADYNETLMPGR